jgi:hypothetical protein
MMLAAAWELICEMALASYWAVVRRNLPPMQANGREVFMVV